MAINRLALKASQRPFTLFKWMCFLLVLLPLNAYTLNTESAAVYVLKKEEIPHLLEPFEDKGCKPTQKIFEDLVGIEYPNKILLKTALEEAKKNLENFCNASDSTKIEENNINLISSFDQNKINLVLAQSSSTNTDTIQSVAKTSPQNTKYVFQEFSEPEPLPSYSNQLIEWQGNCGCVPPQIHTTGYGIYPYWHKDLGPQTYDFSVFSRVAYYGIYTDHLGGLHHHGAKSAASTPLNDKNVRAFIETARLYGSKVDWLIDINWDSSKHNSPIFFKHLAIHLEKFLSEELPQPSAKFRSWLTLGAAPRPRNGDGVTLYIKNYPNDEVSLSEFNKFFNSLKQRLKENDAKQNQGRTYQQNTYVNLMVDQKSFVNDKGPFGRGNLLHQLDKTSSSTHDSMLHIQETKNTLILVLLESPHNESLDTIYDKTISIERALIIPVMVNQFKNFPGEAERNDPRARNITYTQEAFGGVGFWPISPKEGENKEYEVFNQYIADRFADIDSTSFWTSTLCHHRWLLLGILNIWLLVTFIYLLGVFYLSPHHCRSLPRPLAWLPHPVTVVLMLAPPIGLWLYLLLADPLFGMLNVTGLLVLVIVALALWAGIRAIKVLRRPTPNRGLLRQLNRLRLHND